MRRTLRTRLLTASLAALATIVVVACGDDDTATRGGDGATLSSEADTTPASNRATDETSTDETVTDDTVSDETTGTGSTPSSGDGEVGSQEEYVEAARGEVGFADAEINDCVAEAIVNDDVYVAIEDAGLTVERFREDGPNGIGIGEDVASELATDLAACGDLLPQVLTDDAQLACAEGNITNDEMGELLAYQLFGLDPSEEVRAADTAVRTCLEDSSTTTT